MKLTDFLQEFKAKKGGFVVLSSIIEKIGGLLLILIATHLISKSEFGFIVYANTSLDFLFPFIGFGMHQGLIYYGSRVSSQTEKTRLFNDAFITGMLFSLLLIFVVLVLGSYITIHKKNAYVYLLILSVQFISLFLYEMLRVYFRLLHLNSIYAKITNVKTVFLTLFTFVLTYYFKGIGYVLGLVLSPLIVSIFFYFKFKIINFNTKSISFNLKKFLKYGMLTSFSGVLSQLLFAVDILLIGNLITDETLISQYKTSTVLPFSFLFLSVSFIRTNFVKIANKSVNDKNYVKQYYVNYLKIFSVISIFIVVLFYFFSDYIFLLFGKEYTNQYNLMFIFSIGVAGALLLRIPLGNILSAVGLPKINAINSFIVLIINTVLSYILIHKMGIIGAAIATSSMFWLSGILSLIAFIWYLKK